MDLMPDNKSHIDSLTRDDLLAQWRTHQVGDPWFTGETYDYWTSRMRALGTEPQYSRVHWYVCPQTMPVARGTFV